MTCPECGIDEWYARDHNKIVRELNAVGLRFKQLRAEHGREQAEWELREIDLVEQMKWLQRKTRKQAEAIRNLEAKLRRQGQQPYKEEDEEEVESQTPKLLGSLVFENTGPKISVVQPRSEDENWYIFKEFLEWKKSFKED